MRRDDTEVPQHMQKKKGIRIGKKRNEDNRYTCTENQKLCNSKGIQKSPRERKPRYINMRFKKGNKKFELGFETNKRNKI